MSRVLGGRGSKNGPLFGTPFLTVFDGFGDLGHFGDFEIYASILCGFGDFGDFGHFGHF